MDKKNKIEYTPIIQDDNGNIFPLPITKSMVERWLDILNYWYEHIEDFGERYPDMKKWVEKFDKTIDEIYNLSKEM